MAPHAARPAVLASYAIATIKNKNMNNTITIPPDGLNAAAISDYGRAIDVLAAACDFPAYDECRDNNMQWMDENMAEAFKQYNHEAALIEALNAAPAKALSGPIFEQCGEDAQDYAGYISAYSAPDQPLQLGAYMALKHPDVFAHMVTAWTDAQREAMYDCLGDYIGRPGLYPPLAAELQRAYEWAEEYALKEYLNGDRSDVGLLGKARRVLALESVKYNEKTGVLKLEYDPESDELRELYGLQEALDYMDEDAWECAEAGPGSWSRRCNACDPCKQYTAKRDAIIAGYVWPDAITARIESEARRYIAKEKAAREKRRAEYEKTREYQQARRDEAEAARIAKLQAMKKTQ